MGGISFQANLNKISTTVDGGWRITLDVPQSESEQVMKLSERRDENLQVAFVTSRDIAKTYDQG